MSYQGTPKIEFDCLPKKEVSSFTVKILIYIYAWKKEILYLDYGRVQIRSLVICVCAQSLSHIRLFATTMDYSLPGSSVCGIFQARILEWVAISSSKGSSQPRDQTRVSSVYCIGRQILYH